MSTLTPTPRTMLKRRPARGSYERATVHAILDEALVCHVALALDAQPVVTPMTYARVGDTLYLHGSAANRTLRALREGIEACINVTLLDGLVLSRSARHHSVNFRSVTVFGTAHEVTDAAEKLEALRAIVEHAVPGRWPDVRELSAKEVHHPLVLSVPLDEASAKVPSGGPAEEEADYALPVWAGEIPLRLVPQSPVDDVRLIAGVGPPPYATRYQRPTCKEDRAWNPRSES